MQVTLTSSRPTPQSKSAAAFIGEGRTPRITAESASYEGHCQLTCGVLQQQPTRKCLTWSLGIMLRKPAHDIKHTGQSHRYGFSAMRLH